MLNKYYCHKCWNKIHIINGEICGWVKSDKGRWKEGYVWCPAMYIKEGETIDRKITEQPPTNCPFLIEHLLSNED